MNRLGYWCLVGAGYSLAAKGWQSWLVFFGLYAIGRILVDGAEW